MNITVTQKTRKPAISRVGVLRSGQMFRYPGDLERIFKVISVSNRGPCEAVWIAPRGVGYSCLEHSYDEEVILLENVNITVEYSDG